MRYSNRSGISSETSSTVASGVDAARVVGQQLVQHRVAGRVVGLQQELPAGLAVGRARAAPSQVAGGGSAAALVLTRARTSIVSSRCGRETSNSTTSVPK